MEKKGNVIFHVFSPVATDWLRIPPSIVVVGVAWILILIVESYHCSLTPHIIIVCLQNE